MRIYVQKVEKKINPRFWRNFLKKRTFRFFFANIPKNVQKQIFKGSETIKKNYEVVFKIWAKKKWTDHPSIPSIPSHPSIKNRRGRLVPRCGSKRQHNDIPVGRLLFRIPFLKGPKPRFESSMTLTLEIRFCLILIVEGRIKTYMCNFLVNSSGSRVVVNLP